VPDHTSAEHEWQKTANAIGLGLGLAGVGLGVSQVTRRPEIALAGIVLGGALTALLWRRRNW